MIGVRVAGEREYGRGVTGYVTRLEGKGREGKGREGK